MMDATCLIRSIAKELSVENTKEAKIRSIVRMRPVLRAVQRKHVIPYVLSIAEKHLFNFAGDSVSAVSLLTPIWVQLMQRLKNDKKEVFDFIAVQSLSMECLRSAVELCTDVNSSPTLSSAHRTWSSLGLCVDAVSVVNRRRRQEDRWFATSDLLSYAAVCVADENDPSKNKSASSPPVSAIAVFDGHNGPEAAEHCSHLAPYLLSLGLLKQSSDQSPSITDLLANLFYELNESVNEGHRNNLWSSGTTATVCAIHGDCISTAWVGDSQAWLINMPKELQVKVRSIIGPVCQTTEFHKSEPPRCVSLAGPTVIRTRSEQLNGHISDSVVETSKSIQEQSPSPLGVPPTTPRGLALALTDTIHRPEFASEFVSIVRTGGTVSTVVGRGDGYTPVTTTFSSEAVKTFQKLVFSDIVLPSADSQTLQVPALRDPNLSDCRVGGLSCVSRALGDDHMLNGVSGLPSVTTWKYNKQTGQRPLCLVVASDGLWDTENCSPVEVAHIAQRWFKEHAGISGQVEKGLSRELTQLAISNGASDNITCLVLWLNRWIPDDWSSDTQPILGRNVRWPRGTRITSLVDFNSPEQLTVRGPMCPSPLSLQQRSSMYAETAFRKGIRYSSPPRRKS
ncbi:hypothetical protein CRM22_008474 [Opisthorchis felineus]|uniref:PPM-type phosphatase domain-containing protein n=1 Tax=Opisthorchis felineus TaxID=147828 RepID=A0A4S2LAZ3_OPIFE|nr:hypothetical protein CRM22_008474 [Opisthorchis felineus]